MFRGYNRLNQLEKENKLFQNRVNLSHQIPSELKKNLAEINIRAKFKEEKSNLIRTFLNLINPKNIAKTYVKLMNKRY